jgi:hypothetical protein
MTPGPATLWESRYEAALMNGANRTLQQLVVLQDRRARENGEDQIVEVLPGAQLGNPKPTLAVRIK